MKPYLVIAAACFILLVNASAPAAQPPAAVPPEDLQRARANLKLSEQTRDRIAAEVATLESSGKASADVVTAYRAYLERVEELVVEHRGVVARMEAACNAHRARSETAAAAPSSPPPAGSAENPSDRLDELDRRFNASLAAFDEMLLKELRLIQAAAAGRMKGMAEAAAAAGREAAEKGRKESPAGKGSAEETAGSRAEESGRGAGAERTETAGGRGAAGDAAGAGSQPPGGWGPGGTGAPGGSYRPDPDDDIVARQLREAAEKETDPELKAKLWKEYEEYQKSRVRP